MKKKTAGISPSAMSLAWHLLCLSLLGALWLRGPGGAEGLVVLLSLSILSLARWRFPLLPAWTLFFDQAAYAATALLLPDAIYALCLPVLDSFALDSRARGTRVLDAAWLALPAPALVFALGAWSLPLAAAFLCAALSGWALRLWSLGLDSARRGADRDRRERYDLESLKGELLSANVRCARMAELAERSRIARDLHDHAGHELTAAHLALQAYARLREAGDPQAEELLVQATGRVAEGLELLRRTVHGLAPNRAVGLEALEDICRRFTVRSVGFQVHGDTGRIPAHVWSVLEPCLKEALANAARHAEAGRIDVALDVGPGIARLSVGNDTRAGGHPSAVPGEGGLGLRNLRQRARDRRQRKRRCLPGLPPRLRAAHRAASGALDGGAVDMRVLIAEDDLLVARSLKVLLSAEADIEVVGLACDGERALAACDADRPDAVLMDIRMPGMDGIEATRRIKERWPEIRVMMLTTFEDDRSVRLALQAGAEGYSLKSAPVAGIARKLRALASGSAVMDAELFRRLAEPEKIPVEGLSPRETEVMELVAQGCPNKEIADRLFISEGTARNVLSSVLEKLGLRDRTQLAIYFWRRTP